MLTSWLALGLLSVPSIAIANGIDEYDARAQAIVDSFSAAQVIGQMTQLTLSEVMNGTSRELNESAVREYAQLNVGSYLNTYFEGPVNGVYGYNASEFRSLIERIQDITMEVNGGHPIIYGIDSVHGASYVVGPVLFPHQINSGASFNPDLVYEMARITARDTEAAGIPWIFGPILDLSQNKMFARTHETYGEDPYLASVLGVAHVQGLQSYNQTAACIKHFIAYSKTPTGQDRDDVLVSDFELLNNHMPPFKAAIDAGALTVMENYISLNGDPVISSTKILNDLLRHDMGFDGVLLTDWNEIYNLYDFHRTASSREEAVAVSLKQTSVDISMVAQDTDFIGYALNMLKENPEQETRLRESVKRVIKLKLKLGLYETPVPGEQYVSMVGNDKDREVALELARESIVLLSNRDNVLPLPKNASVFITGPSSDNIGYQCGGWTYAWQGYSGNEMFPNGISIRKGVENLVGNSSVTYFNGLGIDGNINTTNLAQTVRLARQHEYTIAAIGEPNYTEKAGDINDPALPEGMEDFIEALAANGTKVIVVLLGGRPRLLGSIPSNAYAIINGFLPCEVGGQAIAEILFGEVNPSGKLPITYPMHPASVAVPYNHLVTTRCRWDNCQMQWEFGTGLSYTQFNYSSVVIDKKVIGTSVETLTASVTVTNTGTRAGKETIMLFLIQPFRRISVPNMKMLKKFKKIDLQPGESMEVSFTLSSADWGVYKPVIGSGLQWSVEDTEYVVAVKPDTRCDVYTNFTIPMQLSNPLCASFSVNLSGRNITSRNPSSQTPSSGIAMGAPVGPNSPLLTPVS
uniref:beta-glucosidase n=1 Tax=Hyaloperonospora arabidopsidis (strain Emoy2) TaxID=559515 RepID=M4BQD2_HYAAE